MPVQMRPANIDFSQLANIGANIGTASRNSRLSNVFSGGLPMKDGAIDYAAAANALAQSGFTDEALKVAQQGALAGGVYGTPIYTSSPGPDGVSGTDDDEIGVSAIGKRGGLTPLDSGGRKVLEPQHFINQGTQVQAVGSRSGQPSGTYPIDNAGEAAAKKEGESQGAATASIPDVLTNANNTINTIDQAIAHPGRATATGMSSTFNPSNYFAGTEATSYREGILKQVQGQAFLGSIQQMRGLGSLSDAEGRAASAAQTALTTAQTDEDHLHALMQLKAIELRGVMRTYQKAGQQPPPELIGAWRQAEDQAGLEMTIPFASGQAVSAPSQPNTNEGWTDIGNGIRIRPKR